jgi:hypothetical protein
MARIDGSGSYVFLLPPPPPLSPTATPAYVGSCSPDSAGCLLGCARQARRKGCLEKRTRFEIDNGLTRRLPFAFPHPSLFHEAWGWVRTGLGQTMSAVYKGYALSSWSLLACRLLVSLVGALVARLGCSYLLLLCYLINADMTIRDRRRVWVHPTLSLPLRAA